MKPYKFSVDNVNRPSEVNTMPSKAIPGLSVSPQKLIDNFGIPAPVVPETLPEDVENSPLLRRSLDKVDLMQSLRDWNTSYRAGLEKKVQQELDNYRLRLEQVRDKQVRVDVKEIDLSE